MIGPGATAEVKATVDVRPARSQVFLVATTVLAGVSVLCGAFLIVSEINYGWLFVLFAVLLAGGGFWAWMKSQSDSDLEKAHPYKYGSFKI